MSSSGCCAGSAVPVSLMAASFAHHQILSLFRMQHGIAMAARRFTLFEAHEPLFAMPRTDWGFHPGSQSLYRRHLFSSHSLKKQETIMAGDTLIMTLDGGDVVIKLRPDLAPTHVEQITALANEGFYDGVVFQVVIPGFMAQGGDPTGPGMTGTAPPHLNPEFKIGRPSG